MNNLTKYLKKILPPASPKKKKNSLGRGDGNKQFFYFGLSMKF